IIGNKFYADSLNTQLIIDSTKVIIADSVFVPKKDSIVVRVKKKKVKPIIEKWYNIFFRKELTNSKPDTIAHKHSIFKDAETYILSNGLRVILVNNSKLPFVSYKYYFDSALPLLKDKKGIELVFKELWGKQSKYYSKSKIKAHLSTSLSNLNVEDGTLFVDGLRRYKLSNLKMLTDLAFNFKVDEKVFIVAKNKIRDSIISVSKTNNFISEKVSRKLTFGDSNPNGEFYNADVINELTIDDLYRFYRKIYNPNQAHLVVYGDVELNALKSYTKKYISKYKRKYGGHKYYLTPYNLQNTKVDFIENYSSDEISVFIGNVIPTEIYYKNWAHYHIGKEMLFNNDYGLLSEGLIKNNAIWNFENNISKDHKYFHIKYNTNPNNIDVVLSETISVLNNGITEKPNLKKVNVIKKSIVKTYNSFLTDPEKISDLLLKHYITGLDNYFVPNIMEMMNNTNYEVFSNEIKKSIKTDKMRIVISGKPEIALPLIEKLGFDIDYFDENGDKTYQPALDRAIPKKMTVSRVMNKYTNALGGRTNIRKIKKLVQWWKIEIGNNTIKLKSKLMLPHKRLNTFLNDNEIILKSVFNESYGYVETGGYRRDFNKKEIAEFSTTKSIFPESYYLKDRFKMKLVSLIPIKGEFCYKVDVRTKFKTYQRLYLRVSDGMLIRKEELDKKDGDVVQYYNYSDFKTFEGVVFPYKIETVFNGKKAKLTLTQMITNDKSVNKKRFK
ncbi:MAG: insulinase family protein, partial [Ichthyobacteriaceae bacterium]|nr:insulinase family protein [Ichthyobacteriaceae bacterium]